MWFDSNDISFYKKIVISNLHGYVLPHAGTKYSGNIYSHTLRFRPRKQFENILIMYLPATKDPDVDSQYHEYFVPHSVLKMFYPNKRFIPFNVLKNTKNTKSIKTLSGLNKSNTLFIISADFSHFKPLQEAIKKENCAANSLMLNSYNQSCIDSVDDIRTFNFANTILDNTVLQWVGRTRSGDELGVGYLSFLIRDAKKTNQKPDGLFVTAFDKNMNHRECLGNTTKWSSSIEANLIKDVLLKASTTSRLTNGTFLDIPVTNYTVTYLYNDETSEFIRGWHAILKNALYLPTVFLENTYDNGNWIKSDDLSWPSGNNFDLTQTFEKLNQKAGMTNNSKTYTLFYTECIHKKVDNSKKQKTLRNNYKKQHTLRNNSKKQHTFNKNKNKNNSNFSKKYKTIKKK